MYAPMYIETVANRSSPPAILLRSGTRQGKKTIKQTHANLSHWPPHVVQTLRQALAGKTLVDIEDVFQITQSTPHGHVQAILGLMRKLGVDRLISSTPSRERNLVMGLVAQRLIDPMSKSAIGRCWSDSQEVEIENPMGPESTLAEELGIADVRPEEVYQAMDWVLKRKPRIEKSLAARHLAEGHRALYDVSSSSYYGRICVLAKRGYNRDGEKLASIVYGLLTDEHGRPVAIDVYAGNTNDAKTVPDQLDKIRRSFGLRRIVLVGDRGMLTRTTLDQLSAYPELGYLSALNSAGIRALIEDETIEASLFDRCNLAEIASDEFPGERLVVCLNPLLRADRRRTRKELLDATCKALNKLVTRTDRRTHKRMTDSEIGEAVGRVINRFKMRKHIRWSAQNGRFKYEQDESSIQSEEQLDGLYVIRTREPLAELSAPDAVRAYKGLMQVEQAFRCLKSLDIRIRPIRHWTEDRVRAHIFLCMLSYYVEWHMRKALSTVLFQDDELEEARWTRDPVAKAEPSQSVKDKKCLQKNAQGWPVCSFEEIVKNLGKITRNQCVFGEGKSAAQAIRYTEPSTYQRHIFELLGLSM